MQNYTPFGKTIKELQASDLIALREVLEGWYIEYKQEMPSAAAVAKSLAAFANTYGGWLFFGIKEDSKENPAAGAFIGIPREQVDSSLQRMRKCATDHLNPTPHFETCVVWGPDDSVGLAEDRGIICVRVPQSPTAPHVHKSGQIYRRVADASEPKAETDRFVLDQLWRRGDQIKLNHEKWFEKDPEFADQEKRQPYVRIMLIADPWYEHDIWFEDDDQVREILSKTTGISSIPFDSVYTSAEGYVGRQLKGNDPQNLTLTWRLRPNLQSDIIVPLPLYQPRRPSDLLVDLHGYSHAARFLNVLGQYESQSLRIVDLNYVFNILIGIAEIQARLCAQARWTESYRMKAKVLNVWRTTPFVDVDSVIDGFVANGLPMCLDTVAACPIGTGPDSYMEIPCYADIENDAAKVLLQALKMFMPIAFSFGIPAWLDSDDESDLPPYYEALQAAGRRAIDVQKNRNRRIDG